MKRFPIVTIASFVVAASAIPAHAQNQADGTVLSYSGEPGQLIVSRDGIVYWLTEGDDLFDDDVVRAQRGGSSSILYNGCEFELPENEDVTLGDQFCSLASAEEGSMAMIASEGNLGNGVIEVVSGANAPFLVGGTVLSAGGIAAATGGGNGGTGSTASQDAGAQSSTASSPS
ncbi:MAG: hypothetical protein AAGK70_12860 [Pseudomonadota bacterium]